MADKKLEYILDMDNKLFVQALKDAGINTKVLEKELEKTGKTGKKAMDETTVETKRLGKDLGNVGSKGKKAIKEVTTETKVLEKELGKTGDAGKKTFSESIASISSFAIGLNQGIELVSKLFSGIKALSTKALELDKNSTLVEKRLKTTRTEATLLNSEMQALAETFGVDVKDEIEAANVLMKQFGITSKQAIDLLASSAKKVPDDFGEILDQVKEYSSQFSQIGVTAEQFLAISTQALQQGVFNDKGVDAIKEFNISIREMQKPAVDALAAIGLVGSEITEQIESGEKTVFDILKTVTGEIKGLGINSQETGLVLADLFKGAGEDAGDFILSIGDLEENLASVEDQISDSQKAQLELNKAFTDFESIITRLVTPVTKLFNTTAGSFLGEFLKDIKSADVVREISDIEGGIDALIKKENGSLVPLLERINIALQSSSKGAPTNILLNALSAVNNEISKDKADEAKVYFDSVINGVKGLFEAKEVSIPEQEEVFIPDLDDTTFEEAEDNKRFEIGKTTDFAIENEKSITDVIIEENGKRLADQQRVLDAQSSYYQQTAGIVIGGLGDIGEALVSNTYDVSRAIGESIKRTLSAVIDAYVAAEVAKASIGGFLSFGATLLAIGPILAAGALAKTAVSAIQFTDGGGMTTGPSHADGGTKFITKTEPNKLKEFQGREYIFSQKTVDRVGKQNLDAVNFGGANIIPFENGGMTTIGQPATRNVAPQATMQDNRPVQVFLDGKMIANVVNDNNIDFQTSGQNIQENN